MEELNKRKRKYDNLKVIGIIITVIAGFFFLAAYGGSMMDGSLIFIMFALGATGLIMIGIASSEIKKISVEFKKTYVKAEIERLLPGALYYPESGVSQEQVRKSHIVQLQDRFKSEDLIVGEVKDVGFKFSDLHIQDVRKSGKSTTVVTTFKGRFYEFEFNKRFRDDLFLLQPGQYRPFSSFTKIKMESIQFNSEFKIYVKNEHEAFYILTPHFMEKLLELDKVYADRIGFCFQNNKLYIAIDSRTDSFDVLTPGDISKEHIGEAIKEVERIIEFVEFLNLDNKMFLPLGD